MRPPGVPAAWSPRALALAALVAAPGPSGCADDAPACTTPTLWLCPRCSDPLPRVGEGRRVDGRLESGGAGAHTFRVGQLDRTPPPGALRLEVAVEASPDVFDGAVALGVRSDALGLYLDPANPRPLEARSAWLTGLRAWPEACRDGPCTFPIVVDLRNTLADRPVDYTLSVAVVVEACAGADPDVSLDGVD